MRIFFVGDFQSNTGPGMANKAIRKGLLWNKSVLFSDANNKLTRIMEVVIKSLLADGICFCSYSKINIFGIRVAKILNKKTFYLMHGYSTLEKKINNENIKDNEVMEINKFERYIFENVDRVFCVSEIFMNYMKKVEPDFSEKFDYNYNGLDLKNIRENTKRYSASKKKKQIVSIGGGMKRKNNLAVCKAINKLNKEKNMDLEYIVIGHPYTDKEQISRYDFVTYYDELTHEKVLEILAESYLYIQNSTFETFGLALIEGLVSNCNLLVSNKVGAIGVIKTITDEDLIFDSNNIDEISNKIEKIMEFENVDRLLNGILENEIDLENSAKSLINKMLDRLVDNENKKHSK